MRANGGRTKTYFRPPTVAHSSRSMRSPSGHSGPSLVDAMRHALFGTGDGAPGGYPSAMVCVPYVVGRCAQTSPPLVTRKQVNTGSPRASREDAEIDPTIASG